MSRSRVYPETRGSRLAGQLEKKRALRIMNRAKKKETEGPMNNVTKLQATNGGSGSGDGGSGAVRKRRGQELAPRDRDDIVAAIGRYGIEKVRGLLSSVDPNNPSPMSTLRDLITDSRHTFLSRNYVALTGLAQFVRTHCQEQFRFPERSIVPRPVTKDIVSSGESEASELRLLVTQTMGAMQALTASMASLLSTKNAIPALPPREPEDDEMGDPPSKPPKEFKDQPVWMKRKILNDMHSRFGKRIDHESGGLASRAYATAWNRSYEFFHDETGVDIKGRASRMSDKTGRQVHPIDMIEQIGELDRFYDCVLRLWSEWL